MLNKKQQQKKQIRAERKLKNAKRHHEFDVSQLKSVIKSL